MFEMTKPQFRWLLTIGLLTGFIALVAAFLQDPYLPEPLRSYMESFYEADLTTIDFIAIGLGIPFVILWIITIVGLYRFRPFAPKFNLGLHLVSLPLMPFSDPTVELALISTLTYLTHLIDGAIVALTFFGPTAQWFRRPATAG